jgi:cytochrome P450
MFAAAHETTVNLIGNGMYTLFNWPEELTKLQNEPTLIESAIEEILRYDSPQQLAWRSALEDLNVGGQLIKKGEQVMLLLGAANRDPKHFSNPNQFDVRRNPRNHLSFGQGPHNCMGSWMARMQGKIAIGKLVARIPNLEMEEHAYKWTTNLSFRGLETMYVHRTSS